MTSVFLSYGRGDDEPFVERLCQALKARGLDVWFDRESMPSRSLTFHQEIRDAIAARERLVLVVGQHAVESESLTSNRSRTGLPASAPRSGFPAQITVRSRSSP